MTKLVRVENADTNRNQGVEVDIFEINHDANGVQTIQHVKTELLTLPCTLKDVMIHQNRFFVVRESGVDVKDLFTTKQAS